jgi:pimeloyl-ACP methyl ester carboxylesterase
MRRHLFKAVIAFVVLYMAALGWTYLNQKSLMYFPEKGMLDISQYDLPGVEDLRIDSADGTRIQVWHKAPQSGMPMVLYLHGNSYHLGHHACQFREILDLGYGLTAVAYHGFSMSEGQPSRQAIMEDAEAAVGFLRGRGFAPKNILLVGESLGSGVAVELANNHKFGGVFLLTPYTSIAGRAQEIYWYFPAQYLVTENFVSEDKIHLIDSPLLMAHGTSDTVIPHSHATKLLDLAQEPKKLLLYEGKGHSNLDYRLVYREMHKYFAQFFDGHRDVATAQESRPSAQESASIATP